MTGPRQRLGQSAERLAVLFLERKGVRVLERNWRCRAGEIDIIGLDGETVVFVEVRSRRSGLMGSAAESVGPRKKAHLLAAAAAYGASHPGLPPDRRIDVITVENGPRGMVVERIENAIEGDSLG